MHSASRTCALVLCALSLAGVAGARADTIQISLSGTANGALGGQNFRQQTVTFTGQTTSAELAACQAGTATGCTYSENEFGRRYQIPYTGGTVTIGDMGTYTVNGTELIDFLASVYDGDTLKLGVPDSAGGLTFGASMPGISEKYNFEQPLAWTGGPQGSFVDGECFTGLPSQCQYFAATTGGELRLSTLYPGVDGNISLLPEATAVTPEPGTWTLVGTGLLGAIGAVRRRKGLSPAREP